MEKKVNTVNVEVAPDPTKLSHEALQEMRKAGYPKPEGVDWGDWLGPRRLTHRHEIIAMYAATGASARHIAREMGYTESRISIVLNAQRMKDSIKKLRTEYYGGNIQARMNSMNEKAVDVIQEILEDPNERNSVKLNASRELLNRTLGKPKETLEIQNGSIREIFAYLDANRLANKPLAIVNNSQQSEPLTIDASVNTVGDETPITAITENSRNEIDSWIAASIPADERIGKK